VRTQHVVLATVFSVAVLAAISCEGPTAPAPPTTTRIDIDGPPLLAPASTAQYRATAQTSDGSTRDITTEAIWRTSDPGVLSVTAAGLATAQRMGESQVSIEFLNLHAGRAVLVLAPGTYRVLGTVTERGLPVANATVEVIGSPGSATVTNTLGAYRLYGVAGDIQVRVTKDGYKPQVGNLSVAANQTLDFALEPLSPPDDFGGLYKLTVTADSSCGLAPADERTRMYDAQVTQDGPVLEVLLSGARFATRDQRGNSFTGRVAPDGVTFAFSGWDDYVYWGIYYNLVEILAENPPKLLTVSGTVSATATRAGISGLLDGSIAAVRALGQYANFDWWSCSSHTHYFALVRR
jgi:hypothetical protein